MALALNEELPVAENHGPISLQAGQLWRVPQGYISIVQVGRRLAHYKLLNARKHKAAPIRLIAIDALTEYLRTNSAVPVLDSGPGATAAEAQILTTTPV